MSICVQDGLSKNAPRACLFTENPYRLVSLWDILELFNAWGLYQALRRLELLAGKFSQEDAPYLLTNDRDDAFKSLEFAKQELTKAHFSELAEKADRNRLTLALHNTPSFYAAAGIMLHELFLDIDKAVMQRKFVLVRPERLECLDNKPFGDDVHASFPQAQYDIRQAVECFGVDANTAAIFHLMRTAEHGLRALAHDRGVKLSKKPIELATWEEVIRELEKAELAIQNYPKTHAREAQYEFFHGAMMELRSFKNVWRNRYAHTRGNLNEEDESLDADKAMRHVRSFMHILASVVGKRKRTPKIWKRDYRLK